MTRISKYISFILIGFLFYNLTSCSESEDIGSFTPDTPEYSFDKGTVNVSKDGGDFVINVTSNLPWRAKSDADWISFKTESGIGNGSFEFSTARNRTINERRAEIVVWVTSDDKKTITVIQAPSEASDLVTHYYVKVNGSADNDGLSWSTPMTLEKAMDEMIDGDYLHIAAGTYTPTQILSGGTPSNTGDITFEIHSNVNIVGGYPANATDGATADPAANLTVLSGLHSSGQSFHTVAVSASQVAGKKIVMKGLTITNGKAAASGTGNVTINGVPFYRFYGGGLIIGKSNVELIDCEISNNESGLHAGGVYIAGGGNVNFENCVIKQNIATTNSSNCGGVFIDGSTAYFNNCSIISNACTGVGAGIYAFNANNPTYTYIYNSTIANNNNDGNNNNQTRRGGGFYGREYSETVIVNSTFYGNTGGHGAGISMYGASGKTAKMDIISSTIAKNNAFNNGGGIEVANTFATVNVYNSIVSGNTALSGNDIFNTAKLYNSILTTKVYDTAGNELSGPTFDYATMLGALANNGGKTETCLPLGGVANPATTNGMSVSELENLAANHNPVISASIVNKDQTGKARSGKTVIGAVIN